MARVYGLILLPAGVYLFWFWVHFAVLTKSGTGDDFMSPAFQETLQDSAIMLSSQGWFSFLVQGFRLRKLILNLFGRGLLPRHYHASSQAHKSILAFSS